MVPNVGALIAGPFETLESGQLHEAFAINFFTHVYACRVAVPLMKERGGGCIVFTGSDQALQPDAGLGPYAQAKAATHCFAKMLARELAPDGIRVNVVAPGMTRTPLVEVLMQQRAREFGTDTRTAEQRELSTREVPLARLGEPEEVAEAVLYLATASFCTAPFSTSAGGTCGPSCAEQIESSGATLLTWLTTGLPIDAAPDLERGALVELPPSVLPFRARYLRGEEERLDELNTQITQER